MYYKIDTIFINSKNSKTSDPYRLISNPSDKIDLKRSNKYVALSSLSIYYPWIHTKKSSKNNSFHMSAPTWNNKFELPDGSYFIPDIKDYFEYTIKKHETVTDNIPVRIHVSKT